MFNKNFYPTPQDLISDMWFKIKNRAGRILEPSAGKGDILDYINKRDYGYNSDKPKLFAIEIEPELSNILTGKGYNVIADDFLSFNTYSKYDVIVMNPPFDNGALHLLKALEIMKDGGEIVCLLNAETLKNAYSNDRKRLVDELHKYNAEITYIQNGFKKAERKTAVEVALVYVQILHEPLKASIFENVQFEVSQRHKVDDEIGNDVVKYEANEIIRLVKDYETEIELFSIAFKANEAFNTFAFGRNNSNEIQLTKRYDSSFKGDYNNFVLEIRQKYWKLALNAKAMSQYITDKVRRNLDETLEKQAEVEFNEMNILKIKQVLLQFFNTNLENSAVEVFDEITKYAQNDYSGNVHYYTGWKTNKACRINKKVIRPQFGEHNRFIPELEKVLNYFDGFKPYKTAEVPYSSMWQGKIDRAGIYECDYIKVQLFLKGTAHIWFKRVDLLDQLNMFVGRQRNWLPDEATSKAERTKYNKEVYQHYEPTVDIGAEINTSGVMLLN